MDEEIKEAIKTALDDGGIKTVKEACNEPRGCEDCRFHQNGNPILCIFNVCPLEWGDMNG